MGIDADGNYIDSNLLSIPYLKQKATFAGISLGACNANEEIKLVVDGSFLLQNTGRKIKTVSIQNITANITITLLPGIATKYIFTVAGSNELQIVVTLDDNTTITTKQRIMVSPYKKSRSMCGVARSGIISSAIPFQGYDEIEPTTTNADYHIYYRFKPNSTIDCEDKLKKPIIFIDGFDAGNRRNFDEINNVFLSTDKKVKPHNIADSLRARGYDIVILNFPKLGQSIPNTTPPLIVDSFVRNASNVLVNRPRRDGGADFIERNAMVFVALVQRINDSLQRNAAGGAYEQLAIIGPSMGGQISRYGLAYMEKQYGFTHDDVWLHNTRIWVSFDSPHEGANISIGAQQALHHLGFFFGDAGAKATYLTSIRSNAARQLLIEQMDGLNGSADFHQKYYYGTINNGFDALNTNGLFATHGYPKFCRKVALVNGSGNGTKNVYAGAEVMYMRAVASLNTVAVNMHLRFMPSPGSSCLTYEGYNIKQNNGKGWLPLPGYFSTNNTTNPTINMSRYSKFILMNLNYYQFINWVSKRHFKLIRKFRSEFTTTNANLHGSMDAVPGGTTNVVGLLGSGIIDGLLQNASTGAISCITDTAVIPNSCFIPTISALGFRNNVPDWNTKVNDRNLVCNNEIYFDNYFLPATNQEHVSITDESFAWCVQELEKGHVGPGCAPICASSIVGGDMCVNYSKQYSLNLPLNGSQTATWSSSHGLTAFPIGTNATTYYFNNLASTTQSQFIYVHIENNCGASVDLFTPVAVSTGLNASLVTLQNLSPANTCTQTIYANYNGSNNFAGLNATFQYRINNGTYSTATTNPYFNINCVNTTYTVSVKVSDNCGLVGVYTINTTNYNRILCSCKKDEESEESGNLQIEAYPNPTSDKWKVIFYNPNNITKAELILFDLNGKIMWQGSKSNFTYSNIEIPANNLSKGMYLLKVISDNSTNFIKLSKE